MKNETSNNDFSNQNNHEYISTNNSLQSSPINHYDQEGPTIIDNNKPGDNNSDSDNDSSIYTHGDNNSDSYGDSSIYTNAHTFDENFCKWIDRKQSNEPIHPGDVIKYYDSIGVFGNKRWLRHVTVEAVDPVNCSHMPRVLNNGDVIPSTTKVKCIRLLKGNILVDHPGIFRSLDWFEMKKEGKTIIGDVMVKNTSEFKRIIK